VDTSPYYTPLLSMFEHMANNRFMHRGVLELFDVCETVGDVESLLAAWSTGERRVSFGGDRLLPGRLGE
jgi:predicted Rossmann-fold nucleotide-binding protein